MLSRNSGIDLAGEEKKTYIDILGRTAVLFVCLNTRKEWRKSRARRNEPRSAVVEKVR